MSESNSKAAEIKASLSRRYTGLQVRVEIVDDGRPWWRISLYSTNPALLVEYGLAPDLSALENSAVVSDGYAGVSQWCHGVLDDTGRSAVVWRVNEGYVDDFKFTKTRAQQVLRMLRPFMRARS